ncbi:MAG: formate dehydrogenase accessory sulfurtransferase FdhD [Candidatus Bathyarchaeia archaeon]
MNAMTKNVMVSKINIATASSESGSDVVAGEAPLHVFVNGVHFVSFLCSPMLLRELVVGHMLCEGLASSFEELVAIDFSGEDRCFVTLRKTEGGEHVVLSKPFTRLIVSACGGVGYRSLSELLDTIELKPLSCWRVRAKTVSECVRQLNVLADTFRKTGGVHVAALFKHNGELVSSAEDVGRHSAVDKAVGVASLSKQDLGECFLALSGRMTADIVLKAARTGIPLVASLAAAVDSGVEVALKTSVTLAGFVRGSRITVYANPERIEP